MHIIRISKYENGGHDNQTINGVTSETFPVPEGWAVIPEAVGTPETLENYPFGEITVEDRDGVPTVTGWTPLPLPEEPEPPHTDQETRLAALEAETAALAAAIERGMSL